MSTREHIVRGFKATLVSRAVYMLSSALLMIVLARVLNPDGYGALYWAIGILMVVQLFADLGLGKSTARYISEYSERDEGQLPHLLRSAIVYKLVVLTVVAYALLLFHERIAVALGDPDAAPFLAAGVLFIVANSFSGFSMMAFQGFNRLGYSAAVQAVSGATRLVFALGFVGLGFGALGALFGYIVGYAIAGAFGLVLLYYKCYCTYDPADAYEDGLSRRLVEYSIPLTATRSANVIDKRLDVVLVGFFLTPAAVGFYQLGKQITDFLLAPAESLGFTISPNFGEQKASGRLEQARRLYEKSLTHTMLVYIPAAVGLVLVADPFVTMVFPQYQGAIPVLQVLAGFVVLQAVTNLTSDSLDYLGRARHRAIAKGVTSVANFGLNLALIPTIGIVGAAIATVATHTVYVAVNLYILHRELSLRVGRLARSIGTVCGISLVMAVAVSLVTPLVSSLVMLFGAIVLGTVIWAGLAIASGLLDLREVRSVLGSAGGKG
ncbi:flippase [Natronobacterium gregoryi]|uniref:Flippase n=2 Tax=Natronobacterium gregoryi TaxID=44930 RepID=L0AFA5_NATGS|nr:flippase [Natronobacterium gregoryi]AFZ71740.1 membrane protein involved in the export of O-antigen and teichoic acid [Natronobacterium gregoryi SP2]ELY72873.1 polysaccharide biosynthesis protein [Natronobacterium gregoryi SP2]PLK21077.1 flippase [Natronobacterium gregoryi SP2]SFI88886.1 Membrane protein involved in the export of O-antigen and teichoic acid [Natronobacterium gregoryi]